MSDIQVGGMTTAYIAFGTNMGDRATHVSTALKQLRKTPGVHVIAVSRLFETVPVGGPPQGAFLNGVVAVEATRGPARLLRQLQAIERCMGRDPKGLEYLIASRHGQSRIKGLVDDLDPGFSFLRNCQLDEPLRRDVANFILAHVVAPEKATKERPAPLTAAPQEDPAEEIMAPIPVSQIA